MNERRKNNPPMWPSLIVWPLVLMTSPILVPTLMVIQRLRKGYWA